MPPGSPAGVIPDTARTRPPNCRASSASAAPRLPTGSLGSRPLTRAWSGSSATSNGHAGLSPSSTWSGHVARPLTPLSGPQGAIAPAVRRLRWMRCDRSPPRRRTGARGHSVTNRPDECLEGILELSDRARPDDHGRHPLVAQRPRDRHLAVWPGPHVVAGLGRDHQLVAVGTCRRGGTPSSRSGSGRRRTAAVRSVARGTSRPPECRRWERHASPVSVAGPRWLRAWRPCAVRSSARHGRPPTPSSAALRARATAAPRSVRRRVASPMAPTRPARRSSRRGRPARRHPDRG